MFYNEPIFFEKNRVFRIYTGGKLFSEFFRDDSTDGYYPEEWVASSVKALNEGSTDEYEGVSKIKGTDLYLNDATGKYKTEILGEREDIVQFPVNFLPGKADHRSVQIDILDAGIFHVESGAQLQERTDTPVYTDRSGSRRQDSGDQLEHS